tara:strand:- start:327 stop:443 length:117 start_codon:yes stop_codon:yes gene_type:complete
MKPDTIAIGGNIIAIANITTHQILENTKYASVPRPIIS